MPNTRKLWGRVDGNLKGKFSISIKNVKNFDNLSIKKYIVVVSSSIFYKYDSMYFNVLFLIGFL